VSRRRRLNCDRPWHEAIRESTIGVLGFRFLKYC
jgi:hypothetical protein